MGRHCEVPLPRLRQNSRTAPTSSRPATIISWMPSTRLAAAALAKTASRLSGVTPSTILVTCRPSHGGVAGDHHDPLRQPGQSSGREGQEDVQEQGRRQHVEQMTDAVQHGLVDPLQRGKSGGETGGQHQRPETAFRPAPPRQDAADHVRDDDPADEQALQTQAVELVAGQREDEGAGDDPDTRDGNRPERPGVRSAQVGAQRLGGRNRVDHERPPSSEALPVTSPYAAA